MSDRIAVMMGGEILQVASPDQLYNDPRDLRVAEFIGSPKINTLSAEVDADGYVTILGRPLRRRLAEASRTVTIAVRSEHIAIIPDDDEGAFEARLVHKENLGSDVFVHVILDGPGEVSKQRLIIRSSPQVARNLAIGLTVRLRIDSGKAMAFAPGGARIAFRDAAQEPLRTQPIAVEA